MVKKKVHETVIREVIEKPTKKNNYKKRNYSAAISRISKKQLEQAMESQVNKVLVENFVSLQKVMVDTSIKFDNLSGQISKL